jgi:cytochrome b6-f complex iron-sulfur subunit
MGSVDALPPAGAPPTPYNRAKFWWVNSDNGTLAIYKVCTHLGCIYDWKPAENKFICPCHGSQFSREGQFLAGPAPRNLDRFVIRALDSAGNEVARTDEAGDPLVIPAGSSVIVETGQRIHGEPKA